jgi:(1->4)-alpha-D-glucan 1-alpha-D-glucosylmutase
MAKHSFARVPGATYRLQLHPGFGFAAARAAVPYLRELGITDLYLSPSSRPGAGARTATTSPTPRA